MNRQHLRDKYKDQCLSNESGKLKTEPHGVFKEVTKQCTNKDHYQSVRTLIHCCKLSACSGILKTRCWHDALLHTIIYASQDAHSLTTVVKAGPCIIRRISPSGLSEILHARPVHAESK